VQYCWALPGPGARARSTNALTARRGAPPQVAGQGGPNIEPDGQLSQAEEGELYRYYGLDYDTVTLDTGAPAGQTRAGPAGQPDQPEGTDRAEATRVPEPIGTTTGELVDTGIDAAPSTPTRESRSRGLDRAPDASVPESEHSQHGVRDELPATGLPGKTVCPWARG
jgi:hypothetical protein